MTAKQTDIAISGGGIAGLSLGILLARAGADVAVIEPAPPRASEAPKPSGRTVALMERSLNVLKPTDIEADLAKFSNPMRAMRIIDDSQKGREPVQAEFPATELGMEKFGLNIPNLPLRNALWNKAKEIKNLRLIAPDKLTDYSADGAFVTVQLENGKAFKARLLVGTDGRNSAVRKIAGIDASVKDYKQSAITCLISHSRNHDDIATEFHRPGGPLALVPLPGKVSSVVWVNPTDKAEALMRLRKQEFEQALQDATNDVLGTIKLESDPESWPLASIRAKALTARRIALAAEAAHVMSPITAQGLNLSLRDVAALSETIIEALRLGIDPGSKAVLEQYERRRAADIATRVRGVDSMNRIVSEDLYWLKQARRRTLKVLDALPPVKRFAMRQGLAPQIDRGTLDRKGEL